MNLNEKKAVAAGRLNAEQAEKIMWCFKDGARTANQLSLGEWEVVVGLGEDYETIEADINNLLDFYRHNGY